MKYFRVCLLFLMSPPLALEAEWRVAEPGYSYAFPQDHYGHRDFKTEWWYFTGHLDTRDGREFGYQLTFFRQGVLAPGTEKDVTSRFVSRAFYFAHFAVTDLKDERFRFAQKLSRGAFGEAGDGVDNREERVAWIDDWEFVRKGDGFTAMAKMDGIELELDFESLKAPVINGANGISQKSAGEGNASHYYSMTRLATRGTLTLDGEAMAVTGESWFDREWGSSQLGEEQVGWDWFSLQFTDGSELMIYRLRKENGETDEFSGGVLVEADGSTSQLTARDFAVAPEATWKSEETGANYPISWRLAIPSKDITLEVRARLEGQELSFSPVSYWEGMVGVTGRRKGKALEGRGYLEMTGYAAALGVLR
jgi:predicted secreted hydrolase